MECQHAFLPTASFPGFLFYWAYESDVQIPEKNVEENHKDEEEVEDNVGGLVSVFDLVVAIDTASVAAESKSPHIVKCLSF